MCVNVFKKMYGISNKKYYAALNFDDSSGSIPVHGQIANQNASKETNKFIIHNWISEFVKEAGEQDPTCDIIRIPKYISETSLYPMFENEWILKKRIAKDLPSSSTF